MKNLKNRVIPLTIATFLAITTCYGTLPNRNEDLTRKYPSANPVKKLVPGKRYEGPIREISVKVAYDEEYAEKAKKKKHLKLVEKVSESLEYQVGIRLVVREEGHWDSDDAVPKLKKCEILANPKEKLELGDFSARKMKKSLREMEREVGHGKSELLIGFTGQTYQERQNTYSTVGLAEGIGKGNSILVSDSSKNPKVILAHEVCHLFGAQHTDKRSIMYPDSPPTEEIDKENKETILKNKFRIFYEK